MTPARDSVLGSIVLSLLQPKEKIYECLALLSLNVSSVLFYTLLEKYLDSYNK